MKQTSRRRFLAGLGAAFAGLGLAACGGGQTTTGAASGSATAAGTAGSASSAPATTSSVAATTSAATSAAASAGSATGTMSSAATSSAATSSAVASTAASGGSSTRAAAAPAPTPTPFAVTVRGTKVTFWHTQSGVNGDLLNGMVAAFNASQSTYTIAPEYKGSYDNLYQANLAALNAGQPVPLSVAYENQVADYYSSNMVVAWDEYINTMSADDKNDFFPAFLELGKFPQFGSKFLTYPFSKSLELMWYNADLLKKAGFDKPPATWDDFQQQVQKVGTNGVTGWEFSADASRFATWVFSRHGDLISADGKTLTINTPEGQASLELLANLVKAKQVQAPTGFQAETDFYQQKAAFYQDSSSARSFILAALKKANVDFNWTAEMPPVGQSGQDPASDLYGGNVCLFKTSADAQRGAWEFMKWFSATDQTAKWALGTGYMPLRKSAANTEAYKKFLAENPRNGVAINGLQYKDNKGEPKVAAWQQVRDILASTLQQVIAGTANPKDALAAADKKANEALKTS